MLKPHLSRDKITGEENCLFEMRTNQYCGSRIRLQKVPPPLFSQEVVNLGRKWENKPIKVNARADVVFPCSPSDCRDYTARWKIREDCLKWLADLLKGWPQVLAGLIQRGGRMDLMSYIGLIRLINQSHPQPPISFCRGYFYEMGYRRSSKFPSLIIG